MVASVDGRSNPDKPVAASIYPRGTASSNPSPSTGESGANLTSFPWRASSLVLGLVGAGGIGFELLSAMSRFQYRLVSLYLIVTFVIVITAERLSSPATPRTRR